MTTSVWCFSRAPTTGTQLQRPVDHASYAAVRSSHAVRQDLGFLRGFQGVSGLLFCSVDVHPQTWILMILMILDVARLQISDKLRSSCPLHCCIFDASKRTSAPDILPWLVGRSPGYPPLHPTVSAAVADLSSGSTCGATRAFAAGFEGLGSWRGGRAGMRYSRRQNQSNPGLETSPNRSLVVFSPNTQFYSQQH